MGNMREQIDQSWNGWTEVLSQVPADRMTESGVTGHWSVKDLMAHIAVWDDIDASQLRQLSRGETPEPVDWQAVNDKTSAERADWTVDQARTEMHAAHQRLLDTYETNISNIQVSPEELMGDTPEHYDEHAEEVRVWLGK